MLRSATFRDRDALPLGGGDIEAEQNVRGAVDRHGGRDLIERDAVEQRFHVCQRGNGHAAFPDFTLGPRMVGVVAHQGREVESDRSEEHTSELQSLAYLVCRLLLEKKKKNITST